MSEVRVINQFPDWYAPDFRISEWNRNFVDSNVILNSDVYEAIYPEHWGPLSLKFAFNGCEFYESDNCRYRVTDGYFLLFNHNQYYSSYLSSNKAVRSFTINFARDFKEKKIADLVASDDQLLDDPLYEPIKNMNFFSGLYRFNSEILKEIVGLKSYLDGLNYNTLFINQKLSSILEQMYYLNCNVAFDAGKIKAERPSTKIETYRRIFKAKDYIESNFMNEVTLDRLASVACMNPFHLLRKFKHFYNETPHRYLTKVRINEAKILLTQKDTTVTEVCFEVGYEDISSFSKLFKRFTGLSPDNFRSLS